MILFYLLRKRATITTSMCRSAQNCCYEACTAPNALKAVGDSKRIKRSRSENPTQPQSLYARHRVDLGRGLLGRRYDMMRAVSAYGGHSGRGQSPIMSLPYAWLPPHHAGWRERDLATQACPINNHQARTTYRMDGKASQRSNSNSVDDGPKNMVSRCSI